MSRHKSKAIPGRNLRLADQIQKDLAGIIQREIDTTRAGLITLSGVELSTDYAHAKVYFTVLGAEPEAATALLNEKAGWLHSQLYKLLHIHTVPTLRFFHDEQIARGIEMSILIDRANRSGPIRACLTNLKTSPDRAVVAASTFRIPTMAKRRGLALDGVLLLDKPVGLSSNHALQRAKRTVDAAKAGHTGTLDPFATGLLLCCMGRATKISGAMLNADKTYRATLQFGEETDSGDLTGNVVATAAPGFTVTEQALRDALSRFRARSSRFRPCTRRSSATASRCTSMRGRVSSWSGRRARSRFTASSCCPCPGRRQRSMSHAVKARTSARWPRTSGARWVLCPPGGAAAHARRAVFAGPRRHAGRLAGHARPQAGIACIERIAGGPAAFKTLKDSL